MRSRPPDRLKGVITDRDIVIRTLADGRNPLEVRVGDVMTDDVDAVTPDDELREVIELMGSSRRSFWSRLWS